jgi:hypothetical protein
MIISRVIIGTVIFFLTVPFLYSQINGFDRIPLQNYKPIYNLPFQDSGSVTKTYKMSKSPWGAVLRSALLPGLGQFYNESYWKIPIITSLIGYFGYQVYSNHKQFSDYREQYASSQSEQNPAGNTNLKILREFYRDQRDEFIWYLGLTYLVNLVDAYVDAHLFDFDVSEDIPRSGSKLYRIKLNLNF